MFRFIIGLLSGIAIGVAAANMSKGGSSLDVRAELERIRKDLQAGDFDALGAHLEKRFKELQSHLDDRFAEVEDRAGALKGEAKGAVDKAAEAAEEAAAEAAEAVKEPAGAA